MEIFCQQYAVTGTAVPIHTALAITNPAVQQCKEISIQYAAGAANPAFLGNSLVTVTTNIGFTFPVVAANIPPQIFRMGGTGSNRSIDIRSLYLIGTANAANLFFISILW